MQYTDLQLRHTYVLAYVRTCLHNYLLTCGVVSLARTGVNISAVRAACAGD